MIESTGPEEVSVYYKSPSMRKKLAGNTLVAYSVFESLFYVVVAAVILFFLFVGGQLLAVLSFLLLPAIILIVAVLGLMAVARFIQNTFFRKSGPNLLDLENRIIEGNSVSSEELQELITAYTKMKCLKAAEFYSQQHLLEISDGGGGAKPITLPWVVATSCHASTGKYFASWKHLFYLHAKNRSYETVGQLTLSANRVSFESEEFSFSCRTADIKSIELKRHPFWLFPLQFNFIKITIEESGLQHVFCLSPSNARIFDNVSDLNKTTNIWMQRLQRASKNI